MLLLLFGTGVFLSLRCGFPQARHFGMILRCTLGRLLRRGQAAPGGGLSPFQAMTTALAGTVGTGNVAGVAGAIFLGGPGAVFWMWVSAFFGMCTKFAEIALALKTRVRSPDGTWRGGAMYTIERGLGRRWRWLACLFALMGGLASFGIGNLAQSSEIAGAMTSLFGVPPLLSGLLLAAVVAAVLLGGVRRIGHFTAVLVPLMAGFYLLAGLFVLVTHLSQLPAVFRLIVRSAFRPDAVGGGLFGSALAQTLRHGFARGVFSNEAGLGSAPIAHAASSCREPCEQAMWGVVEVFLDTFVICTITALTVLLSGLASDPGWPDGYASAGAAACAAFRALLPGNGGGAFIQLSLVFFALSSLVSWSYYGEVCWGYLFRDSPRALLLFRLLFILCCLPGALGPGALIWEISDSLNGLMALPNLVALLLLSGTVGHMTSDFFSRESSA